MAGLREDVLDGTGSFAPELPSTALFETGKLLSAMQIRDQRSIKKHLCDYNTIKHIVNHIVATHTLCIITSGNTFCITHLLQHKYMKGCHLGKKQIMGFTEILQRFTEIKHR